MYKAVRSITDLNGRFQERLFETLHDAIQWAEQATAGDVYDVEGSKIYEFDGL